jgi:hypothetical protein
MRTSTRLGGIIPASGGEKPSVRTEGQGADVPFVGLEFLCQLARDRPAIPWQVIVWDVTTGEQLCTIQGSINQPYPLVALIPDSHAARCRNDTKLDVPGSTDSQGSLDCLSSESAGTRGRKPAEPTPEQLRVAEFAISGPSWPRGWAIKRQNLIATGSPRH